MVVAHSSALAAAADAGLRTGVFTQTKSFWSKTPWIARAIAWRTRVTAPMTLVRGRRCATSRRNSSACAFGWMGYESGSSTQPMTRTAVACISNGRPWPATARRRRSPPPRSRRLDESTIHRTRERRKCQPLSRAACAPALDGDRRVDVRAVRENVSTCKRCHRPSDIEYAIVALEPGDVRGSPPVGRGFGDSRRMEFRHSIRTCSDIIVQRRQYERGRSRACWVLAGRVGQATGAEDHQSCCQQCREPPSVASQIRTCGARARIAEMFLNALQGLVLAARIQSCERHKQFFRLTWLACNEEMWRLRRLARITLTAATALTLGSSRYECSHGQRGSVG